VVKKLFALGFLLAAGILGAFAECQKK